MESDDKLNIYFVLGPAQILFVNNNIINDDNTIVFTSHKETFSPNNSINLQPKSIKDYIKLLRTLNYIIKQNRRIHVYTPHLLNYVVNKLVFQKNKEIELSFLYDGTMNFTTYTKNKMVLPFYQLKQMVKSLFIFHIYKIIKTDPYNHLSNVNAPIYIPENIPEDEIKYFVKTKKYKTLLETSKKKDGEVYRILVLIPFSDNKTVTLFKSKLEKYLEEKDKKIQIFLKKHPKDRNRAFFLENRNLLQEEVTENLTAEEFFVKYNCNEVVSTYSSALINIKLSSPKCNSVSILIEGSQDNNRMSSTISTMKRMGVEFL